MSVHAATWERVSSGEQNEASQRPDLEHYCTANGYVVSPDCRYVLHDRSASKGEQDEFIEKALADARAGKFTVLVIWASDRLERRGAEALFSVLRRFREAGVRVESVLEPLLGTDGLAGEILTALSGIIAKAETARRKERTRISNEHIDGNGAFRGRIPFGYSTEGTKLNKHLVPNDLGYQYVKKIFERVAGGKTCAEVAAWLTAETGGRKWTRRGEDGEREPVTVEWWPSSVTRMIRRSVYMGLATDPAGHETHACEALVDFQLWTAANDKLDRPALQGRVASDPAMLRDVAYCAACAGKMRRINCGSRLKDGTRVSRFYYRCSGSGAQGKGCGAAMTPLEAADQSVDRYIVGALEDVEVTETRVIRGKNWDSEIKVLEWRLRQLGTQNLDWDEEDARRLEMRAEITELQSRPAEPDRTEEVGTGVSYAAQWEQALAEGEATAWMRKHGIRVVLSKTWLRVTGTGFDSGQIPVGLTEYVDLVKSSLRLAVSGE